MSWGDNGHARPTTEEYRKSKLWENLEKEKKAKEKKEKKK